MQKYCSGLVVALVFFSLAAFGQIDPESRHLIQLGFNQPFEGAAPIAGYAFYYLNQPNFERTNMTLRLAIAPVYLDSELGFSGALGPNTDLGIGVAGGGFADSYFEFNKGQYIREDSFTGHSAELSASIYHLFNPGQRIPLNGVFRVKERYSFYERNDTTGPKFVLPGDHPTTEVRAGLRWGGSEPVIAPDLAMEISGWYEGQFRADSGNYGNAVNMRLEPDSHLFWGRALLIYTLPKSKQKFSLSMTAGTSIHADRFSAYRIGGDLPLTSEFPLLLPGYFYQELSARDFISFTGEYSMPLDRAKHWSLTGIGTIATMDYLHGLEQPGHMNSGVGIGLGYRSPNGTWQVLGSYGYGFEAIRNSGRGAQSVGILCQINLEAHHHAAATVIDENSPGKSRGLIQFLQNLF